MSSNPPLPFLMEDQTDADFFDKLVDDEFDGSESNPTFAHGLEIDDVNAFSNLSINEVAQEFGEEAALGPEGQSKELSVTPSDVLEKEILVSEESVSLVSNSLDNKVESGDAMSGADVSKESTIERGLGSIGSKSVSIKEVQWTLFNADSAQNGATGEAPFSEFFTDLGDNGVDPFSSLGGNSKADPFTSVGDNSHADPFSSLGDKSNADPFSNLGDNSDAYPFGNSGGNVNLGLDPTPDTTKNVVSDSATPISSQNHNGQVCATSTEQVTNDQDLHNSQYWENLYPGWRYDQNTSEWIQVEGYDATANAQVTYENTAKALGDDFVSGQESEVSYFQQTAQSVAGTLAEGCTTGTVSTLKYHQQASTEYPTHMVLDPQYPGWYYDTIAQEWRTLESYDQALQSSAGYSEQFQSWNNANGGLSSHEHSLSGTGDAKLYSPEDPSGLSGGGNLADSVGSYGQQNGTWHPEAVAGSDHTSWSTNMRQAETVAKNDYAQQNRNLWQPETVVKSDHAQQNRNMWQPETVVKSDHAQQNRNMWQPETVVKSDHAQQNRNMWQQDTLANSVYTQQSRNMWQPETVANSDYTQQNRNMWHSETVVNSDFAQSSNNIWQSEPSVKSDYAQQNRNMWQPDTVAKGGSVPGFTENQKLDKFYGSADHVDNVQDQHMDFNPTGNSFTHEQTSRNDVATRFQSFVPSENSSQHFHQPMLVQSQQKLSSLYPSQNSEFHPSQPFPTSTQSLYGVNEGRSSAGRPPHAVVTFGFGGKLVVMKDCSSYVSNSSYGNQESVNSVSVLNIMDVVADKNETHIGLSSDDYFRTLCQQSYPGPLVGGNAGAKEVSRWIDERITKCESTYTDYSKGELLRLLLLMLKIASQSYGRLRSPFGTDPSSKGSDRPENAVAELFASSGKNDAQLSGYGTIPHCLQNMPSEAQLLATAAEVEGLLVSGNRMEALQCAQEGQLWGYALQLAADLGEQFYVDTTRQMAHQMLVAGSPLKTLSLLMAGQPADIFVVNNVNNTSQPSAANISQHHAQIGPNAVLDDWRRNLAVITANRTKGDELVLLHLGDCLWKERGENIAAHMCYLLSETNFESFSDSARLCLIGADHWKFPRTYASPEAIQRTEFYEYSKVLGNSQSVLLPFQPYKIIYAYMLAEVGRLSDSLKYCQAILKSLKANRAAEVDAWKQVLSSLEDRIRGHQQTGFGTTLVPRLVDKFLPFIDSTIHRMMGPPPPTGDHGNHSVAPKVANSQSTLAMQSLVPSASMEPISAWASGGNRNSMPNRSVSEPDFGRSPRQVGPNETSASNNQGKASDSGTPSRFGLFGSNILQKTVGWVSRSRADRQAKLGEKNKFYYDEKLKRWVEEGAAPPAEEVAPPPPPTTAAFQNGGHLLKSDSSPANGGAEAKSPPYSERTSGIPPIPPTSNQFSARGRMGVRSRYVDTFNKGTGTQASFPSPSVPIAKPGAGANAKFFIPTPTSSGEQTTDLASETTQETTIRQDPPTFTSQELFKSPPAPSSMQRFPSMNNLTPTWNKGMGLADNGSGSGSFSRRTASWSGSVSNAFSPPKVNEIKPLGEQLGMSPSSYMPSSTTMHMPMNGGNIGDDLHEVEL